MINDGIRSIIVSLMRFEGAMVCLYLSISRSLAREFTRYEVKIVERSNIGKPRKHKIQRIRFSQTSLKEKRNHISDVSQKEENFT
jgi:hypothetical protein